MSMQANMHVGMMQNDFTVDVDRRQDATWVTIGDGDLCSVTIFGDQAQLTALADAIRDGVARLDGGAAAESTPSAGEDEDDNPRPVNVENN